MTVVDQTVIRMRIEIPERTTGSDLSLRDGGLLAAVVSDRADGEDRHGPVDAGLAPTPHRVATRDLVFEYHDGLVVYPTASASEKH